MNQNQKQAEKHSNVSEQESGPERTRLTGGIRPVKNEPHYAQTISAKPASSCPPSKGCAIRQQAVWNTDEKKFV
jgi:hypothetical protein